MSTTRVPTVHERLADLTQTPGADDGVVLELGCGVGRTLAEIARRTPDRSLIALDVNASALEKVAARLPAARTLRHDLSAPLPLEDRTADVVVCHNTLECVEQPGKILDEIARVLRPGGRAVVGHTDFETLVVVTRDRDLCRRVITTYAELPVLYRHMATADGQMGRRLTGLVRRSPLVLEQVVAHTTVLHSLDQAWLRRLREVTASVRRAIAQGASRVTGEELDAWVRELTEADETGEFLFSETAYLVVATRN